MLSLKGDLDGAERNSLASLYWGRRQQAKPWELARRPAWHDCGRARAGAKTSCELLAPVYGRFTEGCDTKDLLEAKALLAELG
jgi:hypothetical protein